MAEADDLYAALIGGAPSDPAKQAALAAYLRDQNNLGRTLAMSGDRVIGPIGESISEEANRGAQQVSQERHANAQLQMMQEYRAAQERHMVDQINAQTHGIDTRAAVQTHGIDTRAQTQEDAIAQRRDAAANKGPKGGGLKMSAGERTNLEKMVNVVNGFDQVANAFKDNYSGPTVGAMNAAAGYGLGTKSSKDVQNWWQNYLRQFKMEEMNRLFKSRLTGNEIQLFDQAHMNTYMDPHQIKRNMAQISAALHRAVSGEIGDMQAGGYEPDYLGHMSNRIGRGYGQPDPALTAPAGVPGGAGPHPVSPPPAAPGATPPPTGAPAGPGMAPAPPGAAANGPQNVVEQYIQQVRAKQAAQRAQQATPGPPLPAMPVGAGGNLFQGLGGIPSG